MKVLYAIQGTGNGHISRANEIIPILERRVNLDVLVSGKNSSLKLNHPIKYNFKGISFEFGKKGGIDFWNTLVNINLIQFVRDLKSLNESTLLITDNGGIALEYFIVQRKPVLYINHQDKIHNVFFDKLKIPTLEDQFKNLIGTTMQFNELSKIEFYIEKTKNDFRKNKHIIDDLISKNQLIINNQTKNAKKVLIDLLLAKN